MLRSISKSLDLRHGLASAHIVLGGAVVPAGGHSARRQTVRSRASGPALILPKWQCRAPRAVKCKATQRRWAGCCLVRAPTAGGCGGGWWPGAQSVCLSTRQRPVWGLPTHTATREQGRPAHTHCHSRAGGGGLLGDHRQLLQLCLKRRHLVDPVQRARAHARTCGRHVGLPGSKPLMMLMSTSRCASCPSPPGPG